jgi:uncharacterized protein (DUF111 family)
MRETGTFGVRIREQRRVMLARSWQTVGTEYGDIRIKVGTLGGEILAASPEYEDCKAAAVVHDVSIRAVYQAAIASARL